MNKQIVIIGGGPAGMMAGISASSNSNNKVIIFDKMPEMGTKLLVTGKGKCNLTHQVGRVDELFEGYPKGSQFLHSSFNHPSREEFLVSLIEERECFLSVKRQEILEIPL